MAQLVYWLSAGIINKTCSQEVWVQSLQLLGLTAEAQGVELQQRQEAVSTERGNEDTYTRPVVTMCMHIFCDSCLNTNFRYSFACPYCRALITEPPLRDHFLEVELERALEMGLVSAPTGGGRRRPYAWSGVPFPPSLP
ncbi:hypothetical protein B0H11DRAFT_1910729 [Mycena galericulata]|nr:hypothetical protein B0H11DRAFT_1910729 [Mycena galericulata]